GAGRRGVDEDGAAMTPARLPLLWRYTFRELRRQPGRALLTLVGIAVGVASAVAVTTSSTATRRAYEDMYQAVAGRAALEVVAEGGGSFAPDVAALEAVPGVRA